MPLSVGDRLGPYEITAPIGAGGMGEVWKARDTRLDRVVAIKTSKAQFSDRFAREVRAIAALNHAHICQLYDVGEGFDTDLHLSPDEKSLAASLLDRRTSTVQVWITDLTRGATSRMAIAGAVLNASPIWSPDGVQFVFRTNRGTVDLYRRSAAGGGTEQVVLPYQMLRAAGIQSNIW
jgi:hypothetical protein